MSADPNNLGKFKFTCEDNNERVDQIYTDYWKDQHHEHWTSFHPLSHVFQGKKHKNEKVDLRCNADEWPPAYFVPDGQEGQPEWGQRIRWIPEGDNMGAASLWTGFCAEHDGGKFNGQRVRKPTRKEKEQENANKKGKGKEKEKGEGKNKDDGNEDENFSTVALNTKLLKDGKLPKSKAVDGGEGTITEIYDVLTFTRAVFEMKFSFDDDKPSKENDWWLRKNACWPQAIVPDDPGFVLLTDDPWYNDHADAKKTVAEYANIPSRARFEKANEIRIKELGPGNALVYPGDPGSDSDENPRPKKAPKTGSGSGSRRKRLQYVNDRLLLRDDAFNVTRPLTKEELAYNVEVTPCSDRHCSRERKESTDGDDQDSLYIPGVGPPSIPAANVAIPTLVTSIMPLEYARRSSLSADMPLITTAA